VVGPVGNSSSFANVYKPASRTGEAEFTPDLRPGMSDSDGDRETREMYARLTPDDWAVISASAGRRCGPDESGYINPAQPALAVSLAFDRAKGRLQGPVTAGYLKTDLAMSQREDARQLAAIAFLAGRTRNAVSSSQLLLPEPTSSPDLGPPRRARQAPRRT
jgi:hypothetical protein